MPVSKAWVVYVCSLFYRLHNFPRGSLFLLADDKDNYAMTDSLSRFVPRNVCEVNKFQQILYTKSNFRVNERGDT